MHIAGMRIGVKDTVDDDLLEVRPNQRVREHFAIELDGKAIVFRGKVAKKPIELLQFIIASSGSDVSMTYVATT